MGMPLLSQGFLHGREACRTRNRKSSVEAPLAAQAALCRGRDVQVGRASSMGGDSLGDLVDFHPVGSIVRTVDTELTLDPVAARPGRYSLVFLLLHPDRLLRGRAFCFL